MGIMENERHKIQRMMVNEESLGLSYTGMIDALLKYEEENVEYYSNASQPDRIFTHPTSGDVKEKVKHGVRLLKLTFIA